MTAPILSPFAMFKSFIAGILALVAATFGIHHTGISTRPTSLAQSAQTRSAQLAAADTPQRYPVSASTSPIYPPTPKPIGTAPQLSDLSSQGSQASPGTPSTPSRTINTTLAAQLANPFLAYATKADLASATAALQSEIAALGAPTAQVPQQVAAGGNFANPFAAAQSINNLAGVTITNPTITGLTASEIPAISLLNGVTGVLPLDSGGTGWANVNAGSILFGNGASALATSSNLFWDNTDGRLGIGTTTPTAILTLDSSSPNGTIMRVSNSSTGGHIYDWLSTGSGNTGGAGRLDLFDYTEGAARLSIAGNGNVGIGTTTPGSLFSVQGIANWTNATSTYYSTGGVNLTSGCFAIVGNCLGLANIAGTLATNQGGTGTTTWQTGSIPFFNGTNFAENNPLLFWDNTNDRLGVGTGSPFTQLTVPGYSTPVEIASISTGLTNPIAIYVQGRYAYVTDGSSGALIIFDISNPASPTEISSTVLGGTNLSAVYVQGRYAYVINQTTNNYHLHILDISNPTAPVVVSSISTGLNAPKAVYVQGRYAYVASAGNHSLVIFDISNPAAPVMASSISAGLSSPGSVYVQGRYAYVGDTGNNSLVIFDISDPALPVEVVSFSTGISHPQSIYVQGRYAYVTNFNNGGSLEVVDVSNPSSPVEAGSTAAGLTHANGLYVQGRYAYVTNAFSLADSRLVVFDVSNPDSPAEVGSVSAGLNSPSAPSVYVQGRYAYIMSGGNASLVIFDLGGGYVQQLEAGGLETGTLSVRNNFQALDGEFQGGLTIGNNLNVGGSFDLTASTFNATTTPGRNYSIFSINAASSTAPLFTTLYDGNIGIGTSSPDARLTVWGPDTASTSAFVVSNSASTTEFAVYDTGNAVLSGGLTQNSDERLKTNIQSLDASSSLSAIDALTPVSFDWVNGIFGGGDQLGFIAQYKQSSPSSSPQRARPPSPPTARSASTTAASSLRSLVPSKASPESPATLRPTSSRGWATPATASTTFSPARSTRKGFASARPASISNNSRRSWRARAEDHRSREAVTPAHQNRPRQTPRPSSNSMATTRQPSR